MNIIGKNLRVFVDTDGNVQLTIEVDKDSKQSLLESADFLSQANELDISLDKVRLPRSLNANAMFWSLCSSLAASVGVSHDEMYCTLLEKYGKFEIISINAESNDTFQKFAEQYKLIRELGEITEDGKKKYQYQCFLGSSTYNSKEMADLLSGTISECEMLGIPTDNKKPVRSAMKRWRK